MERVFNFLNVAGPVDSKDAEYRRAVHSEAMRAFRRNERLKRMVAYERRSHPIISGPSATTEKGIFPEISSIKSSETRSDFSADPERHPTGLPLSLARLGAYVGTELFDPFDTMPLSLSKPQQALVAHFTWRIGEIPIPIETSQPNELWTHIILRRAMESPLLFCSVCYHASEHLDMLCGVSSTRTSLQLRGVTLQGLNKAMREEKRALSAETIASLLLLLANCLISGNSDELMLHKRALDTIVAMRGGLGNVGFEGALRSVVRWHYARYMMITHLPAVDHMHQEYCRVPLDTVVTEIYRKWLEELLQKCRAFSTCAQVERSGSAQRMINDLNFDEQRTALEHDFVHFWVELGVAKLSLLPAAEILKCGCLAGLLLAFTHLPGSGAHSPTSKKMTAEILRMTEQIRTMSAIDTVSIRYWEILLWSLAVATVLSADVDQRKQLATFTATIRDALGLNEFQLLTPCIHSFIWLPSKWDEILENILDNEKDNVWW